MQKNAETKMRPKRDKQNKNWNNINIILMNVL